MKKIFILWLLIMSHAQLFSQSCSINAGGNITLCGTSTTLQATTTGTTNGLPVWSLVSKPAGAPDPVIANVNSYNTNVTGITFPGNYVFSVSQQCVTGTSTSQVTILAPGDVSTFTAGPDITGISALTGVANLNATIPAGYTASWTYYNLNSFERNGAVVTTNATMSGTSTATPTLTLTKKADHDIDPVYRAVLRITSTNNPSCWYEDNAIVRFIPNPNVSYSTNQSFCASQSSVPESRYWYSPNSSSPLFSDDTTNASANPSFGTTITMNVTSQPAGGNLSYGRMTNGRLYFASTFNQIPGAYVFTLTVTNANGTYTTPNLTFNYNGSQPEPLSFLDPAYPDQMELYTAGNSGGAVYCNRAGTTTPITFYFKIDPADPATLTSTVTPTGIIPAGGPPSIVVSGAGTRNRSATLTPPAGGWRVGTYQFSVTVGNGTCTRTRFYYVHISDGNRPDVEVEDMTVCYPGSGVVSATIPLPEVYKGIISPSYFQDFDGRYELTTLSRPVGSAVPVFQPVEFRKITNTSTIISNLNMQGEYRFRIRAVPPPGGAPGFLEKEYACSGTSLEHEFSIFVSTQVNSNAGSNQTLVGVSQATLNGNNPGTLSSGLWTLEEKPVGAPDPVFSDPTLFNTIVSGLTFAGTYRFKWTITTGNCTNEDEVQILADGSFCEGTDSDGDGIPDMCDQDDDNDGILDTDEMSCLTINAIQPTPAGAIQTFPGTGIPLFATTFNISTTQSAAYIYTTSLFGFTNVTGVAAQTNSGSPVNSITFNRPVYNLDTALDDVDGSETATLRFYDESNNLIPGTIVQQYITFIGNQISNITYPTGQSIHVIGSSGASSTVQSAVRITFPKTIGISRIEYEQVTMLGGGSNNGLLLMNGCVDIDTDGDGIWDRLDLDSDNDGCLDAIEGDGGFTATDLVTAGGTVSVGMGSTAANQNLCADGTCIDADGVPTIANGGQGLGSSQDPLVSNCTTFCYKPGLTTGGDILDTKVGVTSLGRAGTNDDNWPMVRKGGWIALESKTKGFVPNRVAFEDADSNPTTPETPIGIAPTNFVEGMMVYDVTNKCMKMYTIKDGDITAAWHCITTQTCPD